MVRNQSGKIDLSAVANLAAALAALAAVVTAAAVFHQMREESQRARFTASVDSVWQLNEQWNSSTMLDVRSAAASGLLERKPTADVGAVLDFFEELALLVKRGAVDEELAALQFYWPMTNYWSASRIYLQSLQRGQPAAWDEVGDLVTRLASIAARRQRHAILEPSDEELHQFLLDEQGEDECTDDSETRKTPL
jgi:hypothetical protein